MAADGSVIIDVLLDDDEVTSGMRSINDSVGDLKGIAKTVAASLAVVGAAAGAAFVGFSKSAIVAAADAKALNAQFETVFANLSILASSNLNKIADETGIVSSRLKGSFVQIAAFAKTAGMDTAEALSLTERATLAAADSSAFYDKSIESTVESLQSFLKGNFENDAALGISATETTRNAKANELYGQSFIKLSESQKQLTLLAMVEDGNKLSGALGQAARESDGLENLLGNLKAVWHELMVEFGTPILPIVTEWLQKIADAIRSFDATPFITAFTFIWDALDKFASGAVGIYETLKASISGSGGLLAALGLDDAFISTLASYWAMAQETFMYAFDGIKSIVNQAFTFIMNDIVPILTNVVNIIMTNLGMVQEIFTVVFDAVVAVVSYAFEFIQTYIVPILTEIASFIGAQLDVIREFWKENGDQIVEAVTKAFNMVKSVIDFIMPAVLFVIDFVWSAIKQVITGALDVIMGLVKVFSGLFTGDFSKMWEGIKQIFFGAIDLIIGWMSLTFVGGLKTLLTNFAKAGFNLLKGMWDDIAKVFTNMGSTVSGIVNKMATSIVNYFANILSRAQGIFGTLRTFGASIWNSIRSTIANIAQKIWNDVVTKFTGLVSSIKNIFGTVQSVISGIWDKVMAFFKGINLKQVGIDIIQGLINGIGSMTSKITDKVKEIANSIPQWAKKILDIHSPSRVMALIGKWVGIGLSNGIDSTSNRVAKSMQDIGYTMIDIMDHYKSEAIKIEKAASAEITQINKRTNEDIEKIQNAAYAKKRKTNSTENIRIQRLREDAAKKIADIEKKSATDSYNLLVTSNKEMLDEVKLFIQDKKSLNQLSLVEEVAIWQQSAKLFSDGTKEKVEAQKAYQVSLKAINDVIVSTNEEYAGKMTAINDRLRSQEEELTTAYTKSLNDRMSSLMSFAGLFDEFDIKVEQSGAELLSNLNGQVAGFKMWQTEIEKLSGKAINEGLLAELREMGPKALPQLLALNTMTDTQLTQYSALYAEKSKLARTQAEAELVGMKTDTANRITELRATANIELETLRTEWVTKIQAVTKATDEELMSLKQIGKNAGQGLLDGLASMESSLVTKARSIAEAVKSAISGALDIHSPSRWMRDFVAGNMATGWIKGMDKSRNAIVQKATQLGDWMKPEVPGGFVNRLRGVSAPVGNIMPTSSAQGNSVSNSTSHIKTLSPQFINYFTPAESTPSESARKQKQMLQQYAMEY